MGGIYLDAGQIKAALEISRQMLDRNPGPGALMIHTQALDRLGAPKEALDSLALYLQRQPDDRTSWEPRPASPPAMKSIIPWRAPIISVFTVWTTTPRYAGCW